MENAELKSAVETLLFITDQPLPLPRLAKLVGEKDAAVVAAALEQLKVDYESRASGPQILEIAEGFQMATRPTFSTIVRKLYADKMTMRLSSAALETLSIIAYKQPLTRAEVEQIRGVEVIAALETLLEKRLIKVVGRKESVGRPLLYGTTPDFLRHFGLKNLADLPPIESFKLPEKPVEGPVEGEPVAEGAAPVEGEPAPEMLDAAGSAEAAAPVAADDGAAVAVAEPVAAVDAEGAVTVAPAETTETEPPQAS